VGQIQIQFSRAVDRRGGITVIDDNCVRASWTDSNGAAFIKEFEPPWVR
jgi:hypothetical protein